MLEKKVEQSNTLNYIKDYNSHWENMVSKIVEDIYVSGPAFKSA